MCGVWANPSVAVPSVWHRDIAGLTPGQFIICQATSQPISILWGFQSPGVNIGYRSPSPFYGCPQGGHSIGQFWLNAGSMSKTFSQHWFSIYVRSDIYNWLFCKESQIVCCRLWPLRDDGHLDQNQGVWPASVPHRETWLIAQLSKRLPWNARGWEFKTRQLQMQFQKDERSCRFTYLRSTNSNRFVVPRIKTNTGSRALLFGLALWNALPVPIRDAETILTLIT